MSFRPLRSLRIAAFCALLFPSAAAVAFPISFPSPGGYQSPYSFQFTTPEKARTHGWKRAPWNDPAQWSLLPRERWYDREAYRLRSFENLAYGAQPIHFPSLPKVEAMPPALKRERVLTAAQQMIGMHYQHHHLPNFDPYPVRPEWPWIKVANGIHGAGQDCSNFVAWVYNYALGIRLSGAVVEASRQTTVPGPDGGLVNIQAFAKPDGIAYADFIAKLEPGDVIYIRSDAGRISHSVLWVGTLAVDANGKDKYFIIDSTGPDRKDSNGVTIPDGVHLRAFGPNSWYFRDAAVVHRIIADR
ncbi:MAG TPA: NlpC/P60 family protein [Chthoniobacterales bacterium]|nr:NlpC/P60 family protein [Chthoniobacterales bacterium]